MARIQHIGATPVNHPPSADIPWKWSETKWAAEGAYADADYPERDEDERLFHTIAIQIGRKRNERARVDVLAVTRDLEYAIEATLAADLNVDYEVILREHDRVPAAFATEVIEDSTIPECRREKYAGILERAHDVPVLFEVSE